MIYLKLTSQATIDTVEWYFHRLIVVVFTVFVGFLPVWQELTDNTVRLSPNQSFDYIIVGGGSAGSLLAGRLCSRRDVTILLIEAGLEKPNILNIPALGPLLQLSPFDWQYATVPQAHSCKALHRNASRWPSGRVLGGTGHLNYMLHVPGHIKDFASWKNPDSDDWSEQDVRYYFRKTSSGAMPVREVSFSTHLSQAVFDAAVELGLKLVKSVDLDTGSGFAKPNLNMDAWGRRWTSDRYLRLCQVKCPNLIIKTGTNVRRVLINDAKVAYGVELEQGGQPLTVLAQQEVILSAGTIGSPHLLMLSGLGPRQSLQAAKVPVKTELPVGRNLQDHVTTGLDLIFASKHVFGMGDLTSLSSVFQYFAYGTGPFTTALCEAVALLNGTERGNVMNTAEGLTNETTQLQNETNLGESWPPEIQLMVMMAGLSSDRGLFSRHSLGIRNKVWESYFQPLVGRHVVSILPVLLHPLSKGDVTLDPANPQGPPLINPNYLTHPQDVETLVDGLEWVYKIATTSAMRSRGFRINRRPFPGCHGDVFGSRRYWRCYVRQLTLTSYHPVGTCSMGKNSSNSVVDLHLRVHGITNLRIVDASVMPTMPSGNTNAAVGMIAMKAADLILSELHDRLRPCNLEDVFLPPTVC